MHIGACTAAWPGLACDVPSAVPSTLAAALEFQRGTQLLLQVPKIPARMSIAVHGPTYVNDTLVGYVSDPNGRGTLHILFSCLLTLSLCVWSAVHLDLPRQNESDTQYTLRYLKWSLLGLFGPELLIWVAWRQYISARVLTTSIHEVSTCWHVENIYRADVDRRNMARCPTRLPSNGR